MMDNHDRAISIIAHGMKNGDSPARIARHLSDYGLLAEDLPEPCIYPDTGEHEWCVVDGYVNLNGGEISVCYDDRDEDTYLTDPDPEPGEIRITNTTQGRELARRILAACDRKDAQDAQL
ncbi:hypothetical protein WU87_03285 [Corynebacterium minutissimum]|uniref:Uncharacterized protein n=1 Tax=Corynebacterium minutissimum TaxID=38301 RepID=A0ACC4UCE2_9CORY|nr:hypothetical protein WU87_03285 [Corynebacterium minutissimum]